MYSFNIREIKVVYAASFCTLKIFIARVFQDWKQKYYP